MTTRGVRKLKDFLGEDGLSTVRVKRASDVVPVLSARQAAAGQTPSAASGGISPNVSAYLQERQSTHGNAVVSNKFSAKQIQAIRALAQLTPLADDGTTSLSVRRVQQSTRREMANVVAVATLERVVQRIVAEAAATTSPSEVARLPDSSVFVLADSDELAVYLAAAFEKDFGFAVLSLIGAEETPRHPSFPLEHAASSVSPTPNRKGRKTSKKPTKAAKQVHFDGEASASASADTILLDHAALSARACVVVATREGFLAVDKRSAVWKHIGATVVAVEGTLTASPLLTSLSRESSLCHKLAAHREACLGHVPQVCIVATTQESLLAPQLDWMTTLQPVTETGEAQSDKKKSTAPTTEVAVHYAVSEGVHRFQFLFGLLKGLVPHRGLVVHVATKEACAFLYDALYAFVDTELPRHVQILSDYEGESSYAGVKSADDLARLTRTFDSIVDPTNAGGKTSAVLLSCHGLVPSRGCVFLAYDLIVDVPNFPRFVAERLVPAASEAAALDRGAQLSTGVRKRGRSTSPSPPPSRGAYTKTEKGATHASSAVDTGASASAPPAAHYQFILLLLRPNEVAGVQKYVKSRNSGVSVTLTAMAAKGSPHDVRHLFIGEKLQSMNRKLFAVQNAAYAAYKATMTAYCTMGPRDVYNENQVNLDSVAAEFGYTELPLLDLRLKDTPYRPKEDYFKAAKQKMVKERKQYKRFADTNIIGEAPEDHMA